MEIKRNINTRKPTASYLLNNGSLSALQLSKTFSTSTSLKQVSRIVNKSIFNENRRIQRMTENFILCNGGLGDLLFALAASYANNKCRIIHAANVGMKPTIEQFIKAFDVPYEVLERPFNGKEFDELAASPFCVSKCHLPKNLDFRKWAVPEDFKDTVRTLPLQHLLGKFHNPLNTKGIIAIAPKGSNSPSFIDSLDGVRYTKSRELSKAECHRLAKQFARRNTVFLIGSPKDYDYYGIVPHSHVFWATFDKIIDHTGKEYASNVKTMLSIINACKKVISVDTWLKTYSCMAGIPTIVIRTRFNGKYLDQPIDLSENIFLNKDFWNLRLAKIEDLLE
jgi:hypothetical protein